MSKSKLDKSNHRFLLKFVTSYSVLIIIILFMGLYLYHLGIEDAKKSLYEQSHGVLAQSVADMDTTFQVMSTMCYQIAGNPTILRLVNESSSEHLSFFSKAEEAKTYLTNFLPSEQILPISEYYIYLPKTGYVLNSILFNDTELYFKMNKNYPAENYIQWLELLNSPQEYNKFIPISSITGRDNPVFLYMTSLSGYTAKNSSGVFCFEIDLDKLKTIFSNLPLFYSGFLYVTDKNHNEIFHITSQESPDLTDPSIFQPYDAINQTDFSNYQIQGQNMVVTSITSKENGWIYYLVQPSEMAFKHLLYYQSTYSLIIFFTCLTSFFVILYLSSKNVKPILQIHSQLENSIEERSSLEQTLEAQKPLIAQSYIARIMTGHVNNMDELAYILDYLKYSTENRKFCVLYIMAYFDETDLTFLENVPYNSYDELLKKTFKEYFGHDILLYEAAERAYALLLQNDYQESIELMSLHTRELFNTLHDNLLSNYSISIFGGLGNRNSDLSYTWKSYQQAVEAFNYTGRDHFFQAYFDIEKNNSAYYFPFELAQRFTSFITAGSEKQVTESLKLIYHENYEERALSARTLKWLISDLRNTLLKLYFSQEFKNLSVKDTVLLEPILKKTVSFTDISQVSLKLTQCFVQKPEGNKLIVTIKQYIRENYADSSLCLNKISDEFDISESYFSYLFKAETKENFSDYLEKIRMEQAIHLLNTTDIPISSLYQQVGYNNPNSFRRAFKKYHGDSPKAIRDAYRQQTASSPISTDDE